MFVKQADIAQLDLTPQVFIDVAVERELGLQTFGGLADPLRIEIDAITRCLTLSTPVACLEALPRLPGDLEEDPVVTIEAVEDGRGNAARVEFRHPVVACQYLRSQAQ